MAVTSDVVRERLKYIKSVTQFIDEKKNSLNKVLEELGLTEEQLLKSEDKQVCPYNKDHIVPVKSFNKHVEKCKLLSAGYQKDELPALFQDVDFCYENTESIMKVEIDENLLNKIIWDHCVQNGQVYTGHRAMPVSHIDENIMLTQEDRLAVYNYVVKKSHEAGKVIPVDRSDELLTTDWSSLVKKGLLDEQNNKQFASKLEQLAALRDLKRRRQSYRAKNVHITKKSYTEIIREVISNQMEILVPGNSSDTLFPENQADFPDSKSERSNSSKQESRELDRRRDNSDGEIKRREYKGDQRRRSKERDRRGSRERRRYRDRSDERHSNWGGRDRKQSADESDDRGLSKARDEDSVQLSNSAKARRFTEADDALLKEIKKETLVVNDAENNPVSTDGGDETVKQEHELVDGSCTSKADVTQKRSRSDSESSRGKKHKKSKHKKKHSKKHKRRD